MTQMYSTGLQFNDGTIQKAALPQGAILIWSGSVASIPSGWQLCNGTNGTPDLRNRFIVGVGPSYSMGATGGENTVTLNPTHLPTHSHPLSVSISPAGWHDHGVSVGSGGAHTHGPGQMLQGGAQTHPAVPGTGGITVGPGLSMNAAGSHAHSVSTGAGGGHSHAVGMTINNAGSGAAHENRPPYYALCRIMKV